MVNKMEKRTNPYTNSNFEAVRVAEFSRRAKGSEFRCWCQDSSLQGAYGGHFASRLPPQDPRGGHRLRRSHLEDVVNA